jgi:hypothetical protein
MVLTPEKKNSKSYLCEYCNKGFAKESTLMVHMCENKRRHLQKNEKRVQFGYQTFVRFYQLSANYNGVKTYDEFCKSPFYKAFVKFGSYLNNVKPMYMEKYIDHMVTSGVKIDRWCEDKHYENYVVQLILKESVHTALERSVDTMLKWADDNNSVWNHYFLYVSPNRFTWDIRDGKISPWLVLNCTTGKTALSKLNDEQLGLLAVVLDPSHWADKFRKQAADVKLVKEVAVGADL